MFKSTFSGKSLKKLASFRKLAFGAWRPVNDASTYAELTVNMEPILEFLTELNAREKHETNNSQEKASNINSTPVISLTHFWINAIALCFAKYPELNCTLRGSTFIQRNHVDIFITTMIKDHNGYDLSGVSIRDPQKKSLHEIATETQEKMNDLRSGKDRQINRVRKITNTVPLWVTPTFIGIINWWTYTLNRSLEWLGLPGDRFGSLILSPFAALGVEKAFVPLYPFSRTPYAIGIGKEVQTPVAENGKVVIKNCSTITFTMDHRVIDGFQGAKFLRYLKKIVKNPNEYLGKL